MLLLIEHFCNNSVFTITASAVYSLEISLIVGYVSRIFPTCYHGWCPDESDYPAQPREVKRSGRESDGRKEVQRLPKETQNNHKGMHKDSTEIQTNNKEAQKDHKEMKNTQWDKMTMTRHKMTKKQMQHNGREEQIHGKEM